MTREGEEPDGALDLRSKNDYYEFFRPDSRRYPLQWAKDAASEGRLDEFRESLAKEGDFLRTYAVQNGNEHLVDGLRAISTVTQVAEGITPDNSSLDQLIGYCSRQAAMSTESNDLIDAQQGWWQPPISVRKNLPEMTSGHIQALIHCAHVLNRLPVTTTTIQVPLAIDQVRQSAGQLGALTLERIKSGPNGIFANPKSMILTQVDSEFAISVGEAIQAVGCPKGTILWSITSPRIADPFFFEGHSAGAAFGLALDELSRNSRRLGRIRLRRASPRYVLSAGIDRNGLLRHVGGLERKIPAAGAARKTIVVSKDDSEIAHRISTASNARCLSFEDIAGASAATRRLDVGSAVTIVLSLVFLVAFVGVAFAVDRSADSSENSRLETKASELLSIAESTGTESPDYHTKARLKLAASSLADDAGNHDLARQALEASISTGAGVGSEVADPAIGSIRSIVASDGALIATSASGRVAKINPMQGSVEGVYTEGVGAPSLAQPLVAALALNPRSKLMAAVFQSYTSASGSTPATIRILDATSDLRLVGSVDGITDDQVRAALIDSDGSRLLVATSETLFAFRLTDATPTEIGACSLDAGSDVDQLVLDPRSGGPLLVRSDASAQEVDWPVKESSEGAACLFKPMLQARSSIARPSGRDRRTVGATVSSSSSSPSTASIAVWAVDDAGTITGQSIYDPSGSPVTLPVSGCTQLATDTGVSSNIVTQCGDSDQVAAFSISPSLTVATGPTAASVGLPAALYGGTLYYADDSTNSVQGVMKEEMTYPGSVPIQPGSPTSVAAGFSSIAIGLSDRLAVFNVDGDVRKRWLSLPEGSTTATDGDYRPGGYLAVSDDGSVISAVIGPAGDRAAGQWRDLRIWSVGGASPQGLKVPEIVAKKFDAGIRPTGVRFIPRSHDLLVAYRDGSIQRLEYSNGEFQGSKELAAPKSGVFRSGLETFDDTFFIAERVGKGPFSFIRRMGVEDGHIAKEWPVDDLGLRAPILTPLPDGGVFLTDLGGSAVRLFPDGSRGSVFSVGRTSVISGARLIPGTSQIVLSTSRLSITVDYEQGLVVPGTDGVLYDVAVTGDGKYLVGADVFDASATLKPLAATAQRDFLCGFAAGEMSNGEWDHYIGDVAKWRPLCGSYSEARREIASIFQAGSEIAAPGAIHAPLEEDFARLSDECVNAVPVVGRFGWEEVDRGAAEDQTDSSPVVFEFCVDQSLAWIYASDRRPDLVWGSGNGVDLLTITVPSDDSTSSVDVISPEGQEFSLRVGPNPSVAVDQELGVLVTADAGGVRIQTQYSRNSLGFWSAAAETPVGAALSGS